MPSTTETLRDSRILIKETIDGVAAGSRRDGGRDPKAQPRRKSDPYIWGTYIMLLIISVVELFSASSSEVTGANVYMPLIRHGIFLVVGLGCVLGLQKIHYGYIARFASFFALMSLVLLVLSNFIGVEINGAQRAIRIAGFTIQPPEIAKLAMVVLLATILGRNQCRGGVYNKGIVFSALVVMVFGLFLWRNGLTNTILVMSVSISMFIIGGIPIKKLAVVLCLYALGVGVLYMVKSDREQDDEFNEIGRTEAVASSGGRGSFGRSETWIGRINRHLKGVDPDDPITDENRQVIFAKIAQANGGVLGQGPGNSRESARLPLAFSDYIYSIIVEDTGFVGGAILLALYLALVARAGVIAYRCTRAVPAFLVMGCAVLIVFQALVHMAIVTGLFPVSGQPLPLISKGGTSVVVMSIAIGIMLSVSRHAATSANKEALKVEDKTLPTDMRTDNFSQSFNEPQK